MRFTKLNCVAELAEQQAYSSNPFSIQVKLLLCLCVLILGCKPRTIKCTHCNCRLLSFTVLCSHWQVHCIRSEHEARSHIYRYVVSSVRSLEPKLITQVHWTSVQLHWAEHSEKVLNDTSQANQLFPHVQQSCNNTSLLCPVSWPNSHTLLRRWIRKSNTYTENQAACNLKYFCTTASRMPVLWNGCCLSIFAAGSTNQRILAHTCINGHRTVWNW